MKLANRHMLWTEALASVFASSLGLSSLTERGAIYLSLSADLGPAVAVLALVLPIMVMATLLFWTCAVEWHLGREWGEERLRQFSEARFVLNLSLALGMAAMLISIIRGKAFLEVPAISVQCITLMVVFAAASIKAKRMAVLLDPNTKTEKLQREIKNSW